MKVQTLIEKLQKADPDSEVFITIETRTIEKIGVSYDDKNDVELYEVYEEEN